MIRLKENGLLREKASYLVDELNEITRNNKVDYAVVYGEFMYKTKSWPYERRVVCKVEKPENQIVYMYTFVVTNMDSAPEYLIKFYCKRGLMENFIKESKSGFDFASVALNSATGILYPFWEIGERCLGYMGQFWDSWYSYQFRYCSVNNPGLA